MAFLDRSTLIVDAILTNKGRERLSSNSFEINKFALGDDEIDYTLYNESNTNGPNYYGIQIENMPILEASPKADIALQYKLITLPPGTTERRGKKPPYLEQALHARRSTTRGADVSRIVNPIVIDDPDDP